MGYEARYRTSKASHTFGFVFSPLSPSPDCWMRVRAKLADVTRFRCVRVCLCVMPRQTLSKSSFLGGRNGSGFLARNMPHFSTTKGSPRVINSLRRIAELLKITTVLLMLSLRREWGEGNDYLTHRISGESRSILIYCSHSTHQLRPK